jgi:ATP-dependent DNA ligase
VHPARDGRIRTEDPCHPGPDGQVVRRGVVNPLEDGSVQVVPEHGVMVGRPEDRALRRVRHRSAHRALSRSESVKAPPTDLRPPLATMIARSAAELPDERHSARLMFEPKLDGWRCLAFHQVNGRLVLQSRQCKPLTRYLPEIVVAILEQVPAATVLDGELVGYRGGRCDFAALQRRVGGHPGMAAAASFVAFDVLVVAGRDMRGLPYRMRRKRLRKLLADVRPPLALIPATRELAGARAWIRDHVEAGVEDVVVKHREHGYWPRRRCWWKVRTRTTADAVVGGVIGPLNAPEALLLGLPTAAAACAWRAGPGR